VPCPLALARGVLHKQGQLLLEDVVIRDSAAGTGETAIEPGADALGLASPWWLHPCERPAAIGPETRDVLREFAAMAVQVGLATLLLGLGITSSCATVVPGYAAATAEASGADVPHQGGVVLTTSVDPVEHASPARH
jgi:hypothetical protein